MPGQHAFSRRTSAPRSPLVGTILTREGKTLAAVFAAALGDLRADHRAVDEELRATIYLQRCGGKNPGLEYVRETGETFEAGIAGVDARVSVPFTLLMGTLWLAECVGGRLSRRRTGALHDRKIGPSSRVRARKR